MTGPDWGSLQRSAEYLGLRAEIIDWQNRRFVIVTVTATIAAFFGNRMFAEKSDFVVLASSCLLFSIYLALSWALVVYANRANVMLGAYIKVFHEDLSNGRIAYERRLDQLRGVPGFSMNVDRLILALYVCLLAFLVASMWYLATPATEAAAAATPRRAWWHLATAVAAPFAVLGAAVWACHRWLRVDPVKAIKDWESIRGPASARQP